MVGPYDLSGSLGIPGQIDSPKVQAAARHVNEVCRRLSRASGTHLVEPSAANMAKTMADGFTFALLASDVFLLAQWSRTMHKQIEETRKAKR
jgi:2-dehydro-3-deoxyglucarate aldolase